MKKITLLLMLLATITFACNQATTKKTETQTDVQTTANIEVVYHVEGMTCDECEKSIQKGVKELNGISLVEANHEDSTTKVIYNPAQTDAKQIIAAIEKRGYKVVE
jgi:copper chaperone CopZ